MARLLSIQASPRAGRSHSLAVADAFVEAYRAAHPGDVVQTLDVFHIELPAFDGLALQAKYAILHGQKHTPEELAAWRAVEAVIAEFKAADKYVFAVPMWNFGIPYRLKQYIDVLVQPGYTFSFDPEKGYTGLVTGKRVFLVYARGGAYPKGSPFEAYDLQSKYLELILGFMGLTDIQSVAVEPTLMGGSDVAAAKQSEVAVVLVGLSSFHESEGRDRESLELPELQADLIQAVVAANPRTVVVLTNGTPLLMASWIKQKPAVLEAWYLGEQGGNSVTDVLFGDVNPSGKLPDTLAARREDYPDYSNYPGAGGQVEYAEGIFVGYRHFDAKGIEPLFPFGHGLSYTTFTYDDLKITPTTLAPRGKVTVSLTVRNTGQRAGEEVVQLYVHDPKPRLPKAPRELRGFARVSLQPGERRPVVFTLDAAALAYCDAPGKQWRADAGTYWAEVGASSRDLRLRGEFKLGKTWTETIPGLGEWSDQAADLGPDLAQGKPVEASSIENDNTQAEFAVDGNGGTRWSSAFSDPQWLRIDLGRAERIGRVLLRWETAFGSSYVLAVSLDGEQWREVYATEDGQGDEEVVSFAPTQARYVRLTGRKRGTPYGYSLYTVGVYAPGK